MSVDLLAEKYPGWSPYNYTLLNPIKFIDPTGMAVEDPPPIVSGGSLGEVRIIVDENTGFNLSNSGYSDDDLRVRRQVLDAGGPNARALISAEERGVFRSLYDPSGHWDGFSENFNAGWQGIDKNGTANFWMNATAIGVGIPLLATSPLSAGLFSRGSLQANLFQSGISATAQFTLNKEINFVGAFADGFMMPGAGDFIGAGFELTLSLNGGFENKNIFNGKPINQIGQEAMIGTFFNTKIKGLDHLTPSAPLLGQGLYSAPNYFVNYKLQSK